MKLNKFKLFGCLHLLVFLLLILFQIPALAQDTTMVTVTAPAFLYGSSRGENVATEAPTVDFGTVNLDSVTGSYSHWCNVVLGPDGRYYFGIGDHNSSGRIMLIAYDPELKTHEICIDSRNVPGLYDGKWHGRPDINPDTGDMYLMGFYKGQLVHYNIYSKIIDFHGTVGDVRQAEEHTWDWQRDRFYGVQGGNGALLVYDTKNDSVIYSQVPTTGMGWEARSRLLDRETGILYGSNMNGSLMQYNPTDNTFSKLSSRLQGSLRACTNTKDPDGAFWVFDRPGNMFKFFPEHDKVENIGFNFGTGAYVAFIEQSPGGRYLYYSPAFEGNAIIQYDKRTNQKKIIAFLHNFFDTNYGYQEGGFFGGALSADGSSLFLVSNGFRNNRQHPGMFHVHIPASERLEDIYTHVNQQEDNTMPDGLKLSQNYPNPFNPETEISFKINRAGYVSLKIYDLNGRLIRSLIDADINAGAHHVKWDSRDDHGKSVSSGTYLCTIKTNDAIKSIKLTFTK